MSRILIADDNADHADVMAMLFGFGGHQVEVTYDGRAAVDRAMAFLPEVVVLDIDMPRLNGYEAARELRICERHREAVIVAVTGKTTDSDRARAQEAGFDTLLPKPVEFPHLSEAIDRLLLQCGPAGTP